ncbi:CoaE-domain-containing protein [Anaeromyces robustus]|uniref:CoaE-domain-containing protein n=1 Tax=Anaeromyces robustus TaxID=1754192 RepID=A0A1Y1WRA5_9FUNG|nr:CoaE-domain-containing protein [Anaeromyces robustus]|eukprot:ORX76002.1 CoaE-domain-containing protein [Anaeromyces robustus]
MLIIGLTGGIATGKSSVSNHLKELKVPIIDADKIAHDVIKNKNVIKRIIKEFGEEVIDKTTGEVIRSKLGAIVFSNDEKRKILNGITHPKIKIEMFTEVLYQFLRGERVAVMDVPLLFESGTYHFVNKTVVVSCSKENQLKRLMLRNNFTEEEALSRINSQMSLEEKIKKANKVIDNNGTIAETEKQVDNMLIEYTPSKIKNIVTYTLLIIPTATAYGILKGISLFY